MNFLAPTFSAVVAAALTPLTAKVSSRTESFVAWSIIPLAVALSSVLTWSSARLLTLDILFILGLGVVGAVLAAQIVIDLCVRRLPRALSYAALTVFTAAAIFTSPGEASGLEGLLIGAVVMVGVALVLLLLSRGALGVGDVHLAPLLGALVGWFTPGAVLIAWMITAIAGALFTVVGLATKRLARGSMIPYGPFMVFGSMTSVVLIAIRS